MVMMAKPYHRPYTQTLPYVLLFHIINLSQTIHSNSSYEYLSLACGVAPPCELPIIIMCIPGSSNALSLHLVVNCCHKMGQLQQSVNFVELQ